MGPGGLLRTSFRSWLAYFRRDFHPSQQHSELSQRWLSENRTLYTRVGA